MTSFVNLKKKVSLKEFKKFNASTFKKNLWAIFVHSMGEEKEKDLHSRLLKWTQEKLSNKWFLKFPGKFFNFFVSKIDSLKPSVWLIAGTPFQFLIQLFDNIALKDVSGVSNSSVSFYEFSEIFSYSFSLIHENQSIK